MQPYRNYATPASSMRKGPGPVPPMPGNVPPRPSQHEYFEQQARLRDAHENAKKRSQKPVDRELPEGLEDYRLGEATSQYSELRDLEKQLDAVMMRKRLDIQDALQSSQPRMGTLRLWISNTVENQSWQDSAMDPANFDFSSNIEPLFRVKIDGRLIDEGENKEGENADVEKDIEGDTNMDGESNESTAKPTKTQIRKRWSQFFKSISIEFDRPPALQPDNYARIEWTKEGAQHGQGELPKEVDFDRLEFQRKGDENVNITINLVRDESNPRFKLAPGLADILGLELADRKTVLMGIWEYVKLAGLQDENDARRIRCDERLKKLLGTDNFYFPQITGFATRLMYDAPPVSLQYTIRVDQEFQSSENPKPTIYDIPVPLEDPLQEQMEAIKSAPGHTQTLQQIARLDDRLAVMIQKIKHAKAKHGFFTSMSQDPVNFTQRWISSQKRDLDVIMGAGPWGEEDWQSAAWRKGGEEGPWGSSEAWEGIGAYLIRQDTLAKTELSRRNAAAAAAAGAPNGPS